MPTTSSPWASPSSPAGRRLLQTEPPTVDDMPVIDDALLAVGAALVAATDSAGPAVATDSAGPAAPSAATGSAALPAPSVAPARSTRRRSARPPRRRSTRRGPVRRRSARPTHRRSARSIQRPARSTHRPARSARGVAALAATLAIGLGVVASAGLERPAPAASPSATSLALGRAAGDALAHDPVPPVADGQVVVALIEPTQVLTATPAIAGSPSGALAERMGTLVALLAVDAAG